MHVTHSLPMKLIHDWNYANHRYYPKALKIIFLMTSTDKIEFEDVLSIFVTMILISSIRQKVLLLVSLVATQVTTAKLLIGRPYCHVMHLGYFRKPATIASLLY
jgi:hypothetical protein